jgi:salicylate hydroxylase
MLKAQYRGWHPALQTIIDAADKDQCYRWSLFNRPPIREWSTKRVTLLGDAAHPTLPYLAQGAVMSIEDGYVVAACLDKYFGEPGAAFARYEEIRKERTSMVVRKASENKASAFAPNLADTDRIADEVAREWQQVRLRERMDWLYNYDATAIAI